MGSVDDASLMTESMATIPLIQAPTEAFITDALVGAFLEVLM